MREETVVIISYNPGFRIYYLGTSDFVLHPLETA